METRFLGDGRLARGRWGARGSLSIALIALIVLIVAMVTVGCSSTRLAYDNADWFLAREVSKLFCPTSHQRAAVKKLASSLLVWHRRAELVGYGKALKRIAKEMDRPVSRAFFEEAVGFVEGAWARLMRHLVPGVQGLAGKLGSAQLSCLSRELTELGRERLEKLGDSEQEFKEERAEALIEIFEDWVGDLSKAQKARVASELVTSRAVALKEARAMNKAAQRFVAILRIKDTARRNKRIRAVMTDRYALFNKTERLVIKKRNARRQERIWKVGRMLTKRQRQTLREKLLEYARDFEVLSRDR